MFLLSILFILDSYFPQLSYLSTRKVKSMKYLAELAWEIDFDHTAAFVKVR